MSSSTSCSCICMHACSVTAPVAVWDDRRSGHPRLPNYGWASSHGPFEGSERITTISALRPPVRPFVVATREGEQCCSAACFRPLHKSILGKPEGAVDPLSGWSSPGAPALRPPAPSPGVGTCTTWPTGSSPLRGARTPGGPVEGLCGSGASPTSPAPRPIGPERVLGLERVLGREPFLESACGVHPSEESWPKVVADDGGRVASEDGVRKSRRARSASSASFVKLGQ